MDDADEHGTATLEILVALQMDALIDGDQITHTLIAACMADALRKGETPREVASQLFHSVASDSEWENGQREQIEDAIEAYEEGEAA